MKFIRALPVWAATLWIAACGASKTMKADEASRGAPPPVPSNHKMAECSRIEAPALNMSGQISTYYNNGKLEVNYLRVNFTSVPAEIATSSTHYLQLFRWAERVTGQPTINSIPVRMYFVQKGTGFVSNPSGSDRISKAELEKIITAQKLEDLDVTVANFFDRHFVILTGMELQWDAVKFAYFNSAIGSQAIATGDALLPAFYANPNTYMAANPTPALYTLHPNYQYRTSGASENDYFELTEQICTGFFSRIPASIDLKDEPGLWQKLKNWFSSVLAQIKDWFA